MCIKRNIAIVGNGGFAHEVKYIIDRINGVQKEWNFLGYIDNVDQDCVIGNDEFIVNQKSELCVVIAIGNPHIREKIWRVYKQNPFIIFPNIIDPAVIMPMEISIGEGNIICANAIITADVEIGSFNIINLSCTIGHNAVIKDFCTINPGTNISGDVMIEKACNIGTGTKIIQGMTIGERSVIGAGAVIIHDLPADCTAVGVPARVIKQECI